MQLRMIPLVHSIARRLLVIVRVFSIPSGFTPVSSVDPSEFLETLLPLDSGTATLGIRGASNWCRPSSLDLPGLALTTSYQA